MTMVNDNENKEEDKNDEVNDAKIFQDVISL